MTNKKKKKKGGATRAQLALVGVLAVVLVIVVGAQLSGSSNRSPDAAARKSRHTHRNNAVAAKTGNNISESKAAAREWPVYDVSTLVKFDPLAPPTWYQDAVAVRASQPDAEPLIEVVEKLGLEELQKSGTNIVLIDGTNRIATVGEQRIQVGDKIDGYEVSEITDQGVVLTKSRSR